MIFRKWSIFHGTCRWSRNPAPIQDGWNMLKPCIDHGIFNHRSTGDLVFFPVQWGFLKGWYPLFIIHSRLGFSMKSTIQRTWGTPMETSKEPQGKSKSPRKPGRETDVKAADPKLCNPLPLGSSMGWVQRGLVYGTRKNPCRNHIGFPKLGVPSGKLT